MVYTRIHNKGTLWDHDEAPAESAISPGMVCEIIAAGTVQPHSTEGGRAERLIAQEDALRGKGVDTDYSSDAIVGLFIARPGEVFNLLFASGETGTPGAPVISKGDGTVGLVDNASTGTVIKQVIGYIDRSEASFDALDDDTLKAIRLA